MANIYWQGPKAPQNEVYAALMKELVNHTDDAFAVKFGADSSGQHVIAYVEVKRELRTPYLWKKRLPGKFMGWRLIKIFCPPTYIDIILNRSDD